MQPHVAQLRPSLLALQFTYTPEAFMQVLAAWQPAGVQAYLRHFPFDFGFLLSYGALGWLLAARTGVFARLGSKAPVWCAGAAAGAAVCDACENLLHLHMLSSAAALSQPGVALAGGLSLFKWLLVACYVGALLLALLRHATGNGTARRG